MPHDYIGWIHMILAIVALIAGSTILSSKKGTFFHKKIGKIYVLSMLIVCATAFMIYNVHNAIGVLHLFAFISGSTLISGMIPLYFKGCKNPIIYHLSWMYWSVIGLYCAFAAEIFTRLPIILEVENTYSIFYILLGISSGIVGLTGSYFFKKRKKYWEEKFGN